MARPEHEKAADVRRRELAFSHWRASIVRGSIDDRTLKQELQRALGDANVKKDPKLVDMIREFAAQRAREIASLKPQHAPERSFAMQPGADVQIQHKDNHVAHAEEIHLAVDRLARHFDDYATRFFEFEARETFGHIQELAAKYPKWVDPSIISHCQEMLGKLAVRRQEFAAQIADLTDRAVRAAESGDHDLASKILRKLAGVNAAHPQMLPDEQFAVIRDRMSKAGKVNEHRMAMKALLARERAVADELKAITHAVHHFHHVSRSVPHNSDEYHQAEAAYVAALRELRSHDKEWLSGLILELVDILGEWTHPPRQVEEQLDRFVQNVRESLHHLRHEVRQVQEELGDGGGGVH